VNLRQLIVLTIKAFGGKIVGKMNLHTLMYFVIQLLNKKDVDFEQTYLGPYSDQVDLAFDELIGAGFVSRICNSDNVGDVKQRTFVLNDSGKRLANLLKKSYLKEFKKILKFRKKVNKYSVVLMLAAKTHFGLTSCNQPITKKSIKDKIRNFDYWPIGEKDTEEVVEILVTLKYLKGGNRQVR